MQQPDLNFPPLPSPLAEVVRWQNLHGASVSLAISNALKEVDRPVLIIVPDSLSAARLSDELHFFQDEKMQTTLFPDWETLPYDHFSPHQDIISDRLSALYLLPNLKKGALITTVSTLMQKLPPRDFLVRHSFILKTGEILNLDIFSTKLAKAGYRHVSQVREHGEFAIRGSIIDLFPMGSKHPFRIDLFDNEVDSIRIFSSETQRSLEKINAIQLLPAKEFPLTDEAIDYFRQSFRNAFSGNPLHCSLYQDITEGIYSPGIEYYLPLFFEKTERLFDYLPEKALIIVVENIKTQANDFWQEVTSRYEQGLPNKSRPLLLPEKLFLSPEEINKALASYDRIEINSSEKKNNFNFATAPAIDLPINYQAQNPLAALDNFIKTYKGKILFCAESTGRREVLLQLFRNIDLHPKYLTDWNDFLATSEKYSMVIAQLEDGFSSIHPDFTILTEKAFYGARVMQRRLRKKTTQDPDAIIKDLTELKVGDPVVHIDHGVGRYLGLQTLTVGEQLAEFLTLEYQGGDKLYVPIASLHFISRYTGADLEHTPINKLGTDHWNKAKRKAAEKIRDVAVELLDLYAKRASRPGLALTMPEEQYAAFSSAFPFEETPDQLQAIDQVFKDMTSTRPMDRVICGDVGFGKTEVALRAAFLAVQNNKQVAILVPTTLLAQQHFQNFQDRFADWPIQVEMLSRFRTGKEQEIILTRLKEGKVDIVIGTHKLLQQDIVFKSLGLIIIDEEHRFGVKQKEKLKSLRTIADILTLTATPIPRTLNMALAGIRDLSIIATPPAKRLSVKTFVHEYQKHIVQEAVQREILRGGQVYFLHNDISTINKKAEEIKSLVGEARVTIAHGQMHERELERIMSDFYHRRYNVLVCSTIIESGIDIPTANTIIINRADKFGLAQLHQLRGRVGRSHHQAYAYLLTPPRSSITKDAEKRLDVITAYDDLGIGFTLATHDLEIRGAGELLGASQSGNMQEIGFTLYMDLLSRAVDALKAGREPELDYSFVHHVTEVDLHIPALIPETYLGDVELRLQFYKRIASAKSDRELDEIQIEMIDRFGLTPTYLKNLFAIALLKLKAQQLNIMKVELNAHAGKIEFGNEPKVNPETIIKLIQSEYGMYKLDGPTRLKLTLGDHQVEERITLANAILSKLGE
ncbi:MAG: transcription-repair coupling factor [Gammaproteobacteria bacterium]|nr:transcription-repair coupling factor [Gammaproteobacteria bacterium]